MTEKPPLLVPSDRQHRSNRTGWLRAAVLGANDGLISVSGIVVGIATSGASHQVILLSGVAAAVTGAISMAAGEYVSVQSQVDVENADLALEKSQLRLYPRAELEQLTQIYRQRGLDPALARQVALQLTQKNALAAHARDELGITETLRARPLQAALASAASFCCGAALPVAATLLTPHDQVGTMTIIATVAGLLASGALAARLGGASVARGALRVGFWGILAMTAAYLIGRLFQ